MWRCLCGECCGLRGLGWLNRVRTSMITIHCETAGSFDVIPFKINPRKFSARLVCANLVVFLEGREQMFCIVATCVLDTKIINY